MTNREELLNLIPAYALGALDEDERVTVEALLDDDPEARRLLAEYQTISGMMALATPAQSAPDTMRKGLKAKLANRHAKPETTPVARRFPRWSVLAAAAALIVVIGGLMFALPDNRPATLYETLANANDAQRFTLAPDLATTVSGDLLVSADGSQAILRVADLPPLSDDQSYQLWLIGDERVVSGGVFNWAGDQMHYVTLPLTEPIDTLNAIGMSLEPRGGSPYPDRPSGPRLFAVDLGVAG